MPDLLSTLAGQVQHYSDETLTGTIYELSRHQAGSEMNLMAAFRRSRHAPRGLVDVSLHTETARGFPWPCRSERALRQLLVDASLDPFRRYFLLLRRVPMGGAKGFVWPPDDDGVDLPTDHFGYDHRYTAARTDQELEDAFRFDLQQELFAYDTYHCKILYMSEWRTKGNPLAWEPEAGIKDWQRRMAAACAEAVYTLVGEC